MEGRVSTRAVAVTRVGGNGRGGHEGDSVGCLRGRAEAARSWVRKRSSVGEDMDVLRTLVVDGDRIVERGRRKCRTHSAPNAWYGERKGVTREGPRRPSALVVRARSGLAQT